MAPRITKLSPEQAATLPAFRDEWLSIGLSTERADRTRAEAGVKLAYEAAGLAPPKLIIWLDSPYAGAIGAALLAGTAKAGKAVGAQVGDQVWDQVGAQVWAQVWDQVGDQVGDQVWDQVGAQVWAQVRAQVWAQVGDQVGDQVGAQVRAQVRDQVWDQVGDQVGDQVWAQVGAQVGDQVWDQVGAQVWAQVRAQVGDQVGDQVWAQVGDQVYRAAYGQHDANWLGFYDFFRSIGLSAPEGLHGQMEIAKSAGWWWPFEGAVIMTERPVEIHRSAEGRLHNSDGAALLYPDGWGIWALNGQRVPRRLIEAPETLTFDEVLKERNTEIRRHMLERFGGHYRPDRHGAALLAWIEAGKLKPVSQEDITAKMQPSGLAIWRVEHGDRPVTCDLYRAELEGDEPLNLLTVVCTSTAKVVPLRVPPTIRNAAEARSWTFRGQPLAHAVET